MDSKCSEVVVEVVETGQVPAAQKQTITTVPVGLAAQQNKPQAGNACLDCLTKLAFFIQLVCQGKKKDFLLIARNAVRKDNILHNCALVLCHYL